MVKKGKKKAKVADAQPDYRDYMAMSPDKIFKELDSLEKRMHKAAEDLDFEEAARVRDLIQDIRQKCLIAS